MPVRIPPRKELLPLHLVSLCAPIPEGDGAALEEAVLLLRIMLAIGRRHCPGRPPSPSLLTADHFRWDR